MIANLKKIHFILLFLVIPLTVSCGKKGPPTLKTFEKPSPVKNFNAAHREDEITISWAYSGSDREKIKGFYIEKARADEQERTASGEDKPITFGSESLKFKNMGFFRSGISKFVDKDFETGGKYYYKMRVYSLRNVISDESPVIQAVPLELPSPPEGLTFALTKDALEIEWEDVDEYGDENVVYNIYRSYEKGKYTLSPLNKVPLRTPYFMDSVETGMPVYYTVRSLFNTAIKDEGYPSNEIEVDPALFMPAMPVDMKYIPSEKKVYLMWKESPETWVKTYRIYRKRVPEADFRLIGEAVTPAFTDNEPLTSKTFYHVTAVGPKKESSASEIIEVNPLVER